MSETKVKIKVVGVKKLFGNNTILNDVNLEVAEQDSLAIIGPSGSGKSVLLKTIFGLIERDGGQIIWEGINIEKYSHHQRKGLMSKCAYLFQFGALFDSITVYENIIFSIDKLYNLSANEKLELAKSALLEVGLSHKILELYPADLSGGMQKRVAIARCIVTNPQVIFFDEPTTGLDPIMSNIISRLIIKIKNRLKATVIVITHDMHSAQMVSNKIALLNDGHIVWSGNTNETVNPQAIQNKYLYQFINGLEKGPMQIL